MTTEGRHAPTTGARVVLDIGPHAGALVVFTGRELAGEEIEIRPHAGRWQGVHTEVRARQVQDGVVHAGLFGGLSPGRYDLRLRPSGGNGHGHLPHAGHGAHTAAPPAGAPPAGAPPGDAPVVGARPGTEISVEVTAGVVSEARFL